MIINYLLKILNTTQCIFTYLIHMTITYLLKISKFTYLLNTYDHYLLT